MRKLMLQKFTVSTNLFLRKTRVMFFFQTSDIMLCGNSRQPCEGQVHKPTFLSTVTVFLVIIFIQVPDGVILKQ
jgi:hypothetical protein